MTSGRYSRMSTSRKQWEHRLRGERSTRQVSREASSYRMLASRRPTGRRRRSCTLAYRSAYIQLSLNIRALFLWTYSWTKGDDTASMTPLHPSMLTGVSIGSEYFSISVKHLCKAFSAFVASYLTCQVEIRGRIRKDQLVYPL